MLCCCLSGVGGKFLKQTPALLLFLLAGGLCCQSLASAPQIPTIPPAADWVFGPATNDLGQVAYIKVPQGCKFTDAQGARAALARIKTPVPKGLVGIMVPEVGSWYIVLEYTETGYVKDEGKERLDAETILKTIQTQVGRQNATRAKQGLATIATVVWELKPAYDSSDHTLEWAVRAQSGPQATNKTAVVNQTVRFLGRHGMLDAIVVRPYGGFSDLAPLKQLVKGISFKQGEQYTDYKDGDKVAAVGLAESISLDTGSEPAQVAESAGESESGRALSLWIGLGVIVSLGALAGVLAAIRPRQRWKRVETAPASPIHAQGRTQAASEPSASLGAPSAAQTASSVIATAPQPAAAVSQPAAISQPAAVSQPAAISQRRPVFTSQLVSQKNQGSQRRKAFDYNKYFGDLMSTVSNHSPMATPPVNGSESEQFRAGAGRLPVNGEMTGASGVFQANSELIANQTTFIEEQRRLIQEQTKLIEEKSKLIAEKNQLLKLQSQLMENKLL